MKGPAGVTRSLTPLLARNALVLFGLLALWALTVRPGQAQTGNQRVQVADVLVTGNRAISTDTIMSHIKIRPGNQYYPETLKDQLLDDTRHLLDTRMFKNVSTNYNPLPDGRVNVIFTIQEYPNTAGDIIYKNANHIIQKDLEEMTHLRKGGVLNPVSNRRACFEIEDYLKKKGRFFAHVELEEGGNPGDQRVVFNITEGPVVRVRSIRFAGNRELATDQRLATQIDSGKMFLGLLPLGAKFNPAIVDSDVGKLIDYYKSNGYQDVSVTRELTFSADHSNVDIVFHIHEGQKYRLQGVTLEGPHMRSREEVSSILRAKAGEYYSDGVINGDLRNITDYYGWRGHAVKADKKLYYPEPGLVQVVYEVEEKPAAKVGQVIIVGNEVTQDRVIRRSIGLFPGQILRYPELRIAENDLARLGVFNTDPEKGLRPTLTVLEKENDEYKDILVNVQETQTGSLMFGAGINSNAGLVGSIVLNEKNFDLFRFPTSLADIFEGRAFRGAGQEFRVEAVPGTQLQRYTVSFREPFLFDRPYSLTTSGYYYQRLFNEYTEAREGGRFTIGHQLTRAWSINGGVRVENINVSNVGLFAPPDYTSVQGDNFLAAPRIGATWDTRDSYLRPTQGGILDMSFEEGFGSFTFPIMNLEGSRYFTIYQRPDGSGRHVLVARSHIGWAGAQTPVYERFFAGGFQSLRGFQFRGIGPRINGYNVGGDFLFLNGLEYQLPIRANDQLYLVAFVDSGTVESRISIKDYRVAAGVGLRIQIPMLGPVPIALDFGFPINRGPDDRQQLFSFWVGVFR